MKFHAKSSYILLTALAVIAVVAITVQTYGRAKRSTGLKKTAVSPLTTASNLSDDPQFFVQTQYRDFLNREPDPSGLAFWTNEISSCGANSQCQEVKRINVSAAFFLSIEFQDTGYLVYRTYKTAFGNIPGKPVPITRPEMLPDMQQIGKGVIVNQENWQQQLELNKQAYFADLVTSSRFTTLYPATISPEHFR
jgi:hypothetical protein